MSPGGSDADVRILRDAARPLADPGDVPDTLIDALAQSRFVLLGEASHGTEDFYDYRARITRRLIAERGFDAVAVEGDWPDAWRVNRHVRGGGDDADAASALSGFERFPSWMWRNTVVAGFVQWLRSENFKRPADEAATGFYGIDLYSLHASMSEVLRYLARTDPEAWTRARERYGCFDRYDSDARRYGLLAGLGRADSCEPEVLATLVELQAHRAQALAESGRGTSPAEDAFQAEQNARVVANAERYHRAMMRGHVESWNDRDRHMVQTLAELDAHLGTPGRPARIVVWAHNSHLGDARATEMGDHGELNVGQLVRERWPNECALVGFTTHAGEVLAADDWDSEPERKAVRPALDGSVEQLLHRCGIPRFLLSMRDEAVQQVLSRPRLERAIGVIYRPSTERRSHYFMVRAARQFDYLVHLDQTRALSALPGAHGHVAQGELPATYPEGQ